jgi:E3 ubiquitin-protein ligase TRIP12
VLVCRLPVKGFALAAHHSISSPRPPLPPLSKHTYPPSPSPQVYGSSVTPQVKRQCLNAIAKMLYFTPASTLAEVLRTVPISSLISQMLGAKDPQIAAAGMQMAEILMEKLPAVFSKFFLKEGVAHAVEQLAIAMPPLPVPPPPPAASSIQPRRSTRSGGRRDSDTSGGAAVAAEAAAAGTVPAGATRTPAGDTLRSALSARARRFRARYFVDDQGNILSMSPPLPPFFLPPYTPVAQLRCPPPQAHVLLKSQQRSLLSRQPSCSPPLLLAPTGCDTEGVRLLSAICSRLPDTTAVSDLLTALAATGNDSVSTFELLSSGAVRSLYEYLTGTQPQGGSRSGS